MRSVQEFLDALNLPYASLCWMANQKIRKPRCRYRTDATIIDEMLQKSDGGMERSEAQREQIKELESNLDKQITTVMSRNDEIKRLKGQYDEIARDSKNAKLGLKREEYRRKTAEAAALAKAVQEELEKCESRLKAYTGDDKLLERLKSDNHRLKECAKATDETLVAEQRQHAAARVKLKALVGAKQSHEKQEKERKKEMKTLEDKLADAKQDNARLEARVARLQEAIERRKAKGNELKEVKSQLKVKVDEGDAAVTKFKTELKTLNAKYETTAAKLTNARRIPHLQVPLVEIGTANTIGLLTVAQPPSPSNFAAIKKRNKAGHDSRKLDTNSETRHGIAVD